MKKFLALFFCAVMVFSLAACTPETPSTDTSTNPSGGNSEVSNTEVNSGTNTDVNTDTDTSGGDVVLNVYDPNMEHKFLATDIANHSVVVFDLNKANGDFNKLLTDECVVWEWKADQDPNCTLKPGAGIDAAKYRYSAYYKKDVIIACSSNGNAYVIDYNAKTVLWEYHIGSGPHSVEMMPNGDMVVACSGGDNEGMLAYVPLSAGETKPSHKIFTPSGHGVSYDPVNDCLWVLEYGQIFQCIVRDGGTKNAKLVKVNGSGFDFVKNKKDYSGHVLSPIYDQPGKYWVAGQKLWIFDTETQEFSSAYSHSSAYNAKEANWMKGVAYFPDGTMVQTVPGSGDKTTYDWSCGQLRITTIVESTGKVKKAVPKTVKITFEPNHREFYKVHPFNKNYQ